MKARMSIGRPVLYRPRVTISIREWYPKYHLHRGCDPSSIQRVCCSLTRVETEQCPRDSAALLTQSFVQRLPAWNHQVVRCYFNLRQSASSSAKEKMCIIGTEIISWLIINQANSSKDTHGRVQRGIQSCRQVYPKNQTLYLFAISILWRSIACSDPSRL